MARASQTFRILPFLEHGDGPSRRAYRGLMRWRDTHPEWELRGAAGAGIWSPNKIRAWRADAVCMIGTRPNDNRIQVIRDAGLNLPIVNITFQRRPSRHAAIGIGIDDEATGCVVAEHFITRGFRHGAFLALWSVGSEAIRLQGFRRRLRREGISCRSYIVPKGIEYEHRADEVRDFVRALPSGTGLMVPNDPHAPWMHDLMDQTARRVPDDIAIVSVGDDDVFCESSHPPVSSATYPAEAMGETAAAMLDALLRGHTPKQRRRFFAPTGVHVRASSDIFAVDDPRLKAALTYIRDHSDRLLSVEEVARAAGWNRRALERAFRVHLHRTPLNEMHRARIDRSREMLSAGLPVAQVVERLGFKTVSHFTQLFRRANGTTPAAYARTTRR